MLAWAVVFSHLVYFSDIYTHGFGALISHLGRPAVLIFVIVSGFVITHAIIERPEPYRSYLTRRFMRIFPLFAVTSAIGYFACDVQVSTLARVAYSGDSEFRLRASCKRYRQLQSSKPLVARFGTLDDAARRD